MLPVSRDGGVDMLPGGVEIMLKFVNSFLINLLFIIIIITFIIVLVVVVIIIIIIVVVVIITTSQQMLLNSPIYKPINCILIHVHSGLT